MFKLKLQLKITLKITEAISEKKRECIPNVAKEWRCKPSQAIKDALNGVIKRNQSTIKLKRGINTGWGVINIQVERAIKIQMQFYPYAGYGARCYTSESIEGR